MMLLKTLVGERTDCELWSADWNVEYHDSTNCTLKLNHLIAEQRSKKLWRFMIINCDANTGDIKFAEYFLFKLHLAIP